MGWEGPFEDCEDCKPRLRHRLKYHACCWMWKVALIIPLLHFVLHLLGVPHSEFISFIP